MRPLLEQRTWEGRNKPQTLILKVLDSGTPEVQVQADVVSGEQPRPSLFFSRHLTWGHGTGSFPSPGV